MIPDVRKSADQPLVQRCLQRDLTAWRELYEQHKIGLFNVAVRILGNTEDAEDAIQETFVRIVKALPKFAGDCKLATWIYRILLNTCFSKLKQQRSRARKIANHAIEMIANAVTTENNPVSTVILEQELAALPLGYRSVFILHAVEGFAHEEIASILAISVGTSKSQLFKAKQLLKQRLQPYLEQMVKNQ